jgi:hypothetical protein
MGEPTPILAIHDVGAGGLSNAFPELVHGAGRGGRFDLREVPLAGSRPCRPLEIWCNESAGALRAGHRTRRCCPLFEPLCARERCPFGGGRQRHRRRASLLAGRPPCGNAAASTCRWTCCSASRRACTATCARAAQRAGAAT